MLILLAKKHIHFSGYDQQDSMEFLSYFLENLHEGTNSVKHKAKYIEMQTEEDIDKMVHLISIKGGLNILNQEKIVQY